MERLGDPKSGVFAAMTGASLALAAAVWLLPETAPRRAGLLPSLRPRLGLPEAAKGAFWRSAPAIVAGWATGGLYLSLGAPIMAQIFGLSSFAMQGFVVTLLSGAGALACFAARRRSARRIVLYGTSALALGTALTLIGVASGSLTLYLAALALAGTGFGTCFYGALRTIAPLAPPEARGELFAAIFTLSYTAFGLPVVLAGFGLPLVGLRSTVLAYGLAIVALAAAAGLWRKFGAQD